MCDGCTLAMCWIMCTFTLCDLGKSIIVTLVQNGHLTQWSIQAWFVNSVNHTPWSYIKTNKFWNTRMKCETNCKQFRFHVNEYDYVYRKHTNSEIQRMNCKTKQFRFHVNEYNYVYHKQTNSEIQRLYCKTKQFRFHVNANNYVYRLYTNWTRTTISCVMTQAIRRVESLGLNMFYVFCKYRPRSKQTT